MEAVGTPQPLRRRFSLEHARGGRKSNERPRWRLVEKPFRSQFVERCAACGGGQIPQATRLLQTEFQARHLEELTTNAADQFAGHGRLLAASKMFCDRRVDASQENCSAPQWCHAGCGDTSERQTNLFSAECPKHFLGAVPLQGRRY